MTELIGVAALAVGGYWIVQRVKRKMAEVENQISKAAAAADPRGRGEKLVLDPVSGKYRPLS
ncbi:hypothetical protein E1180_01580 [Roseibium denhamense]|uniref:Uncharacterized protein n=1 Tax=Roseibium denhamense TaxID=76305 RepID=A0ABY1P3K5_9HYPH|nr:hypothetical protein [Roseibium denhamense]MTI04207.1 hypothetical protein [Roseibium denhamense]SMP25461.1 hypothetical protein SAMN06265374_2564 [Roseibium denhamense]